MHFVAIGFDIVLSEKEYMGKYSHIGGLIGECVEVFKQF